MVSARELARQYAIYLSTQLAGDQTEGIDFGLWLDQHWCEQPELPDDLCLDLEDAADFDAQASRAVTWIERDGEVIGLLAGRSRGCYRIPANATPPPIALLLDDARGCSTGSLAQERAFALARETSVQPVQPAPRDLGTIPPAPERSRPAPLPIPANPPDPGAEPSLGGLMA